MTRSTDEWLEADGLGGFASGTVSGRRSRRYHALLLASVNPPVNRYVLVNGVEVIVTTVNGSYAISSQHYVPNVIQPAGDRLIRDFRHAPWPTWEFECPDQTRIRQEFFAVHGSAATVLKWTLLDGAVDRVNISVRPLVSVRDFHTLHHENPDFDFENQGSPEQIYWEPYQHAPGIRLTHNGAYSADPLWYRQFYYKEEDRRGLDFIEDLASPGTVRFEIADQPAFVVISMAGQYQVVPNSGETPLHFAMRLQGQEQVRRAKFATELDRAASQYLVRRDSGLSIMAGYPWFSDWGRDTFIALRGLCLTTGYEEQALQIILAWSEHVRSGMLPNRFPDGTEEPQYNSVDASLWFVIAVRQVLDQCKLAGIVVSDHQRNKLDSAILQIVNGYYSGTLYGIHADPADGLIWAGAAGEQLTWMDAKVQEWVVTPRRGKPVEIQALWVNALYVAARLEPKWRKIAETAQNSFEEKFWNAEAGCLFDVIDCPDSPQGKDASIRPNQILAIGGLPLALVQGDHALRVLKTLEKCLLTPMGLRTLAPGSDGFRASYVGGVLERDSAYHQGTVWPWLTGAWVDAWLRTFGRKRDVMNDARKRFLKPLEEQLTHNGLGHLSEIFDAVETRFSSGSEQIARGCPFQAWSLGEYLWATRKLLNPADTDASPCVTVKHS